MITSMRGCVAYNDLLPWPISSRSFGLGLEDCGRSVASTVPDGFFPYLVQMITSMRRCVACDDLWPWPISSRSFDLVLTWGIQHDSIVWVIIEAAGSINNKPALVQIMVWSWTGNKPLYKTISAWCCYAFMCHSPSLCRRSHVAYIWG